jgi:hypothetical protein
VKKKILLTKSRFKVGSECPTKLYYLDNQDYGNTNSDDPFLRALAEGGFQVGELAKLYHPGGIEISERDYDSSVVATNKALATQIAIVFEAAIRYQDLFVRVDILEKSGQAFDLIEVKAKSFDPNEEDPFFTKKGTIRSEWEPYLLDIAFQTYVARKAFPGVSVGSYLMLADKSRTASVDGINQRFLISRDPSGRPLIKVQQGTTLEQLGDDVLCKVNVNEPVAYILDKMFGGFEEWETHVASLARLVTKREKAAPKVSSGCKTCEFRIDRTKMPTMKSGFLECWNAAGVAESKFSEPMVFDIWNFRKSQDLIEERRYFMNKVTEADINPKDNDEPGLSNSQRQWLQVQKVSTGDKSPYVDIGGLASEFIQFKYPLHFIDFETAMASLPFHKGRRPYEQIAFQFSHHILERNGSIRHAGEFIHSERGKFPNFDFVRPLKASIGSGDGTIFRYSHHENTVLRQIYDQIMAGRDSVHDAEELLTWIDTVTTVRSGKTKKAGPRTMVDLCDLVKKYYYSPYTNGSNSIKRVLPAVLQESAFLREKYRFPVYGSKDGPTSLNYSDWTWLIEGADGRIKDPYKLLPPIFTEEELDKIEPMVNATEIADGGAAMMAFALMQFTEMSDAEAQKIRSALLKYCELDTFAMVMIFEHWQDLLNKSKKATAA